MKIGVVAAGAAVALSLLSTTAKVEAQSADVLARLEAKLDALTKENAALRERVKRIESRDRKVAVLEQPKQTAAALPPKPVINDSIANARAAAPRSSRALSDCGAYRFNGAYVGTHAGVVNFDANRMDRDGYLTAPFPTTTGMTANTWGGELGGQLGYNWSGCSTLLGIEIDGSWVQASAATHLVQFPGFVANVKSALDGYATVRTRAGVVLDNMLLYATGGVALAHTSTTWNTNFTGFGPTESLFTSDWNLGGVAGAGAEWAWTDRLSLRAEGLYFMFASRDYALNSPTLGPVHFTNNDKMWVARAALNYKLTD